MQTDVASGPEARSLRRLLRGTGLPILYRYLTLSLLLLLAFHLYVNLVKALLDQGLFSPGLDVPPDFARPNHHLNWDPSDLLPF